MQDEVGCSDSLPSLETPGLDVLASGEPQVNEASEFSRDTWWHCCVPNCLAMCSEASEMAEHYSVVHSSDFTIINILPDSAAAAAATAGSQSSLSDEAEEHRQQTADEDSWPGIQCPFAGCGFCIASYPGLVMHHRHVHGMALPAKQRHAIAAMFSARRLDSGSVSASAAATTTAAQSTSSTATTDSFVCPLSSCGISCSSRDCLIAHIRLSHEVTDIMQPVCKQETDDSK